MAAHSLPSGGDWALQRSGAVTLEGTEGFTIKDSLFERIDGNGVMLNGYNRNATIASNEFAWVGATCVASWGYSSTCFNGNCSMKLPWREGPDARGGEQPRYTRVVNNLFREMGELCDRFLFRLAAVVQKRGQQEERCEAAAHEAAGGDHVGLSLLLFGLARARRL